MKSFDEFQKIAYKNAVPHTIFRKKKSKRIPRGYAIAMRSYSSAGGDADNNGNGNGNGGNGGGNGGGE